MIFEPKHPEVIENTSEAPLNLSPLKCIYRGKNSFQRHDCLEKKWIWKVATYTFGSVYVIYIKTGATWSLV